MVWQPLDDRRARADLTDHGTTVSLEFRFNDRDEVASIYTAGRMGRFGGGYRRLPWEGRFGDYRQVAGVWLPGYGEVGWVVDRWLERVWKGRVTPGEGWGITPRSGSAPASAR
ncbi:MAG TPA: hypothetical protein ENK54_03900 [Thiotrichales bacterium]|nr:hypothetical protein [Thiotrichales bacterium]